MDRAMPLHFYSPRHNVVGLSPRPHALSRARKNPELDSIGQERREDEAFDTTTTLWQRYGRLTLTDERNLLPLGGLAMQLKMKRSQRTAGVISSNAVFCLDARVGFTPAELASITRYKLANQVIYNSEAAKRRLERGDANLGTGVGGNLKAIANYTMARMSLNISIASLQRGQHVECKSLDELLGAEEAIMEACRNLKVYLDTAATFDGREFLVDFDTDEPQIVAQASAPQPALAAPSTPAAPEQVTEAEFTEVPTEALPSPEADPPVPSWEAAAMTTGPLEDLARWLERQNISPVAAAFLFGFALLVLLAMFAGLSLLTFVVSAALAAGFYALVRHAMPT